MDIDRIIEDVAKSAVKMSVPDKDINGSITGSRDDIKPFSAAPADDPTIGIAAAAPVEDIKDITDIGPAATGSIENIKEDNGGGAAADTVGSPEDDIKDKTLLQLLDSPLTEEIKTEIYFRFRDDIENFINDFLLSSSDLNADKGMGKCALETWQACCTDIGLLYFRKNRYLKKYNKGGDGGGVLDDFIDGLLEIGLELYEFLCQEYRKQFFIYDCCRFLGMNKDSMYRLNELRVDLLKKAHTAQEGSMRTALASGRSNVTAMAILLNHDYDYTRTTQVIHTSNSKQLTADRLPQLDKPQDIVLTDDRRLIPNNDNGL